LALAQIFPLLRWRGHERTAPQQAARRFKEWASLFSGKLFVMLAAYADESETTGFGAFGGYVASVDEWEKFGVQWQQILDNHKVDYFHFSEWAMASAVIRGKRPPHSKFKENQYCRWPLSDLDSFLLKLGKVAGMLKKGTFGGYISIEEFNRRKTVSNGGVLFTAIPQEFRKNGWKFDENLPHGRS
jgi:hypothetical protein